MTPSEIEQEISVWETYSAVERYESLKNKFSVGDILVSYCDDEDNWQERAPSGLLLHEGPQVELVKKYRVSYVDTRGMAWVQAMDLYTCEFQESVKNILSKPYNLRFDLDPDYVNHLILNQGELYDPSREIKEFYLTKAGIKFYNDTFSISNEMASPDCAAHFFFSNVGQSIWLKQEDKTFVQLKVSAKPRFTKRKKELGLGSYKVRLLNVKTGESNLYCTRELSKLYCKNGAYSNEPK